MITDSVDRLSLYETLLPCAGEIAGRYFAQNAAGLPFEVREKRYETKPDAQRRFELHRHTVDLMMCFEGREIIHICPGETLEQGEPLPEGADGYKLHGSPQGTAVELIPGHFAAIFPGEAHMVGGQSEPGRAEQVRKWVVKLPAPADFCL